MSDNKPNPANAAESAAGDLPKGYKPFSEGSLKLEVPERPGYHRHWFRGAAGRIARAQQAGYTFVDKGQVAVSNFDLGGDSTKDGNGDLGTRVSIVSGESEDASGQPERLYLMECPMHLYEYSQKILADRNESVAEALRGGKIGVGENGESREDSNTRYVKGAVPDLFNPNKRR